MLFAFLIAILARAEDCPADIKSKTASISIGFNYSGKAELNGPQEDAQFYANQVGPSVSEMPWHITDRTMVGRGKDVFLKRLKEFIADKEFVVFSYSGHSSNKNGAWSMVLPGIEHCTVGAEEHIENCRKNFRVSDVELKNVFGNKKVLMFNDSCFSGGANLGPNVVHISSSLTGQFSQDSLNKQKYNEMSTIEKMLFGKPYNGAFTERIQSQFTECTWDSNMDGRLNAAELSSRYAVYKHGTTVETRKPQPKSVPATRKLIYDDSSKPPPQQHMSIYNAQPWMKCIDLGPNTCTIKKSRSADVGIGQ